MWFFKKKVKEEPKEKQYELVKGKNKTFSLCSYDIKIYNESGNIIGKTCVSDEIVCSDINGQFTLAENKPVYANVDKSKSERFQNFAWNNCLTFEDHEENQVILATDIIKKIVISVFDSWEEEVQLYKMVEKNEKNS